MNTNQPECRYSFCMLNLFLIAGLRKLVYSGDVDAIVPYTGTRAWVTNLNLTVIDPWRPWYVSSCTAPHNLIALCRLDSTGQTGGFVTVFDDQLSFATVRQAGHMAPYTQPLRALEMFTAFINNQPL